MGFSLTAVAALTDGLTVPDVALGALLRAHELVAGGSLWHSNGTLVALDVYVTRRHTALVTADIRAALLKGLTVLQYGREKTHFPFFLCERKCFDSLLNPFNLVCSSSW